MDCEVIRVLEKQVVNRGLDIGFSEPWELSKILKKENSIGNIIDVGVNVNKHYGNEEECLVIRLKKSFQFADLECEYFVASPRYENSSFDDLLSGKNVNCSLLRITKEQANSDDCFDTSWWRGGAGGFIATLKLLEKSIN